MVWLKWYDKVDIYLSESWWGAHHVRSADRPGERQQVQLWLLHTPGSCQRLAIYRQCLDVLKSWSDKLMWNGILQQYQPMRTDQEIKRSFKRAIQIGFTIYKRGHCQKYRYVIIYDFGGSQPKTPVLQDSSFGNIILPVIPRLLPPPPPPPKKDVK